MGNITGATCLNPIISIRSHLLFPVKNSYSILVKGRVQGIGFRPFVYRQAQKLGLTGQVKNTKQGVLIECQGKNSWKLVEILTKSPPKLAHITEISVQKSRLPYFCAFTIEKSNPIKWLLANGYKHSCEVMPDLAVCPDCMSDFLDKQNRRYFYPFTNCTQCGPRYSIIYSLPYDRPRTTMHSFNMCKECAEEYNNPLDRRFHAQPNACPVCGPHIILTQRSGSRFAVRGSLRHQNDIGLIHKTQQLLSQGKIIAIRSIGGFLLACDANNNRAIKLLRKRKNRPFKPFAIMCKDIQTVKKICIVSKDEIKLLKSEIAPIVLLKKRKLGKNPVIPQWIAPNNGYLGVMLPYTPLHKLLFTRSVHARTGFNVSRETLTTLVMTSANPTNSPIILNSGELKKKIGRVVDYILDHNRPIESRCDDSVVFNYKGPVIVRYSRGYVPEPFYLQNIKLKPVLAFGSDLKNSFAIGQGNKLYLSPYVGNLTREDSIAFLFETLEKYQKWFGIKPEVVMCDLHPNYISVRLAEAYAKRYNLKLVKVQHHYAHLAGVMAEYGITEPVIGVSYDGTGFGSDGAVWGSEIMVLDYTGFERISHLKYMPLIGGDVAITNPKQVAKTYLSVSQKSTLNSVQGKSQNSNTVLTSSMGRLFDAVSSILGLCQYQTFEGQAPIALESEAIKSRKESNHGLGNITRIGLFPNPSNQWLKNYGDFDPKQILSEIVHLKRQKVPVSDIAMYFHNRIVQLTVKTIKQVSKERKIKHVCLSGGVFQNRVILSGISSELKKSGLMVFINRRVPINDGGIAFGQAVLAGLSKQF